MTFITDEQLNAAIEEVVAEKGENFIYAKATCSYAEDGQPSCIVGHVFAKVDPDLFAAVAAFEATREDSFAVFDAPHQLDEMFEARFSPEAMRALATAQARQDIRMSWGEALAAYQTVMGVDE